MDKHKPYTPEEDEYIRLNYATAMHRDIAHRFGRNVKSIRHRASKIGVGLKMPLRRWTEEEDEIIRSSQGRKLKDVAKELGRNVSDLWEHANKINSIFWRKYDGRQYEDCRGYIVAATRNKQKYYMHRKVMEEYLGRNLTSKERVHHIDTIKTNNSLENLFLFESPAEHAYCHYTLDVACRGKKGRSVPELLRMGELHFDRSKGETNVYQTRILRVPDNATSYNYDSIEFKSSDENIASVDSNGLVICKNIGKATISAKTNDDKFQASFEITVNAYPVLEFKSKNPFTIKSAYTKSDGITPGKAWNDLIYSGAFPSSAWQSWVGEEISAVLNSFDNCYYLYLRGSNNTRICRDQGVGLSYSSTETGGWKINGEDVYCSGDIRALLEYEDVENSVIGTYCFAQLFAGNKCLKSAPDLPSINIPKEDITARTTGSIYCYAEMFYGTGIEIAPALPALELPSGCYDGMFAYSSLKYTPALPALSVPHGGYRCMFQGCEYLETVPALVATSSQLASYEGMFQLCPLLKFSTSYDEENGYVNEFKFNKVVSRENMETFYGTGGTFEGDPSTGLVLYTCNKIIYPEE